MPVPDRDYNLEEVLAAFRRDGSLIREKARVLTEEGLEYLYRRMVDEDLSTSAFLDVLKYLAEIGDLKPKTSQQLTAPGPGFSITINIPGQTTPPITIEGEATPVENSENVMGEMSLVGNMPTHQLGKLFDNSALKANRESSDASDDTE